MMKMKKILCGVLSLGLLSSSSAFAAGPTAHVYNKSGYLIKMWVNYKQSDCSSNDIEVTKNTLYSYNPSWYCGTTSLKDISFIYYDTKNGEKKEVGRGRTGHLGKGLNTDVCIYDDGRFTAHTTGSKGGPCG